MKLSLRAVLVVWAVAFLLGAIGIGLAIGAPEEFLLATKYESTFGTVIRTIPNSHGQVVVRYNVNNYIYERRFGPSPLRGGQSVRIYYYLPSPSTATLLSPAEFLELELPFWTAASLLFSMFILACLYFYGKATPHLPAARFSPKLLSAAIAISALITSVIVISVQPIGVMLLIGEALRFTGVLLLLYLSWSRRQNWRQLFISNRFWVASVLILGGWLIERFV